MDFALTFIGVPVMAYLVLASLPRGKPALLGILAAAAISAVLWVTQIAGDNSYRVAVITLVFSAVALAGFVQVLRAAMGDGRAQWVYPLTVVVALAAAGVPMLYELGR